MYALWTTCQHYSVPDSLPDAQCPSLDRMLEVAERFPRYGKFGQFMAKWDVNHWEPMGFVYGNALTESNNLDKYQGCRYRGNKFSNKAYPDIDTLKHPTLTTRVAG